MAHVMSVVNLFLHQALQAQLLGRCACHSVFAAVADQKFLEEKKAVPVTFLLK